MRLVSPGGGEGDTVLQAAVRGTSTLPPAAGWTYLDVGSQAYLPDPSLAVVQVQAAGCGEVGLVLGAEAGAGQAEVGGLYRPTGGWSAGRQVWLKRTLVHSCTPPLPSTPLSTHLNLSCLPGVPTSCFSKPLPDGHSSLLPGTVWYGLVRYGIVWYGFGVYHIVAQCGTVWD